MDIKKVLIKSYLCILAYSSGVVTGVYPVPTLIVAASVVAGAAMFVLSSNRARFAFGLTLSVVILFSRMIEENYFVDGAAPDSASMLLAMNAIFGFVCTVMVCVIEFRRPPEKS